jgi:hypothetical protein
MRERSQSEGGNVGTECGLTGSLQASYRERAAYGVKKKKPFSGITGGRRVLVRGQFMFPQVVNEKLP